MGCEFALGGADNCCVDRILDVGSSCYDVFRAPCYFPGKLVMAWFICLMPKPLVKKAANGMLVQHPNTCGLLPWGGRGGKEKYNSKSKGRSNARKGCSRMFVRFTQ